MNSMELDGSIRAAAMKISAAMTQPTEEVAEKPTTKASQPTEELEPEVVNQEEEELDEEFNQEELPDDSEDDEVNDSTEENLIEFKADGKMHQATLEELKELASAGFNYNRRSQELAQKVKDEADKLYTEKSAELKTYEQSLVDKLELVESLYNTPLVTQEKLNQLREDQDWDSYHSLRDQEESRQKLLDAVRSERIKVQEKNKKEYEANIRKEAERQMGILLDRVPELKNKEGQDALIKYAKSYGKNEEYINSIIDATIIEWAEKARRYDDLLKKGAKPVKKVNNPNVIRKVTKKATPFDAKRNSVINQQRDRFKQTGSIRDAAELLKNIL